MQWLKRAVWTFTGLSILASGVSMGTAWAQNWQVVDTATASKGSVVVADAKGAIPIVVDSGDYPVVSLAANLLAGDVERVSGKHPEVRNVVGKDSQIILAGTLGHSPLIDQLAKAGKLKGIDALRGRWETSACQVVENPLPGIQRALVIVGSDRRGTAYGMMALSERIGVSPWYWWADVPTAHRDTIAITTNGKSPVVDAPDVKYRGIFINDEDAGFRPWASKTYDPERGNVGPKTYDKVFELMLRLRLNYLWPAMHPGSTEFGAVPENSELADKYAIVMGASHTEAMLRNNVYWPKGNGPWDYSVNASQIDAYWEEGVKARGQYEAVWTLGIRGIHDSPMQGPKDMPGRVALVDKVIKDQQAMLKQYASPAWGPVAQCFVPYKEVQPIYDAGLAVPPEVTLIWADDNYGYVRRFSNPDERKRSGGAGVYYHLSYLGFPHSYIWLNTTPPALMWEELHKAWDNQARTMWVLNVGDIKPGEIGIDSYARLAWNASTTGSDMQPRYLRDFARRSFGAAHADEIAAFLAEFYRVGQMRKPECMNRDWANGLTTDQVTELTNLYQNLLTQEAALYQQIPTEARDAWTETVGYPARMLAASGLTFLEERAGNAEGVEKWHAFIDEQTKSYNEDVAGGKWRKMMTAGQFDSAGASWRSTQFPWMQKNKPATPPPAAMPVTEAPSAKVAGGAFSRKKDSGDAHWAVVDGLGYSAKAITLQTTRVESWKSAGDAPRLEYDFTSAGGTTPAEATLCFLPTFRIYPGKLQRLSIQVDGGAPVVLEVPGSNGTEDERGPTRSKGVLDNRVRLQVPLGNLPAGKHTLKISALDPGMALDEVKFPL